MNEWQYRDNGNSLIGLVLIKHLLYERYGIQRKKVKRAHQLTFGTACTIVKPCFGSNKIQAALRLNARFYRTSKRVSWTIEVQRLIISNTHLACRARPRARARATAGLLSRLPFRRLFRLWRLPPASIYTDHAVPVPIRKHPPTATRR